jgi:hypothetical protein
MIISRKALTQRPIRAGGCLCLAGQAQRRRRAQRLGGRGAAGQNPSLRLAPGAHGQEYDQDDGRGRMALLASVSLAGWMLTLDT